MSVNSEINRLNTAKTNIKSAIVDSGVSVPSTASISDYDDYVRAIPDAVLTSADGRYKKIQTSVSSPTASSTTSTTFIDTISQDAQGKITATKKTLPAGASCTGTVTSVKVGTTSYSPSSGVVSLPAYPTTLPANGGNADTVDNKHASDFAPADHTHGYIKSNSTSVTSGLTYYTASGVSETLADASTWCKPSGVGSGGNSMILRMRWSSGVYGHDIFASPNTSTLWHRDTQSSSTNWQELLDSANYTTSNSRWFTPS